MDELIGEFVAETRETLDHIAEALVAWEGDPLASGRLDEIFRFIHTVKGSCGFLDLPRIERLAHAAETTLAEVRKGARTAGPALVSAMLALIDRVGLLVAALDGRGLEPDPETDDALIAALDDPVEVIGGQEQATSRQSRTIRVGIPLLESMMNLVSELVLVRNELARRLRSSEDLSLQDSFARLSGIVGDLRDAVTRTRMQPIDRLFATLPRLVRDTATDLGKRVELTVSGNDVEIDREMVEAIRDPLLHIVRNAIDHGIERPIERQAVGKPEIGMLRVVAAQSGNQISIEISDDGRGIDTAALIRKAVAARRLDARTAVMLDEDQAAQLIFEPGVSTAAAVTNISGRGVGMDVVRANVERLGGSVVLANRSGQGLTIAIRAPLTLSIVHALIVRTAGQAFAIPRAAIEEVVAFGRAHARMETVGGGTVAVVRDIAYPAFSLASMLGLEDGAPRLAVMLTTPGNGRYAIAVDSVEDHQELVVRPMAPQISVRGIFAGQSLADSGSPVVVLDPVGLALMGGLGRAAMAERAGLVPKADRVHSVVTATALDGRRVAVRAALVERLIETEHGDWTDLGDRRFVVLSGRHCPAVASGILPESGAIPALLLNDGERRSVLPVSTVHDLVPLPAIERVDRDGVEGIFQLGGETIALLAGMPLFAGPCSATGTRAIVAAIAERSPWSEALLAPLLEAAGYDVRFGNVDGAAVTLTIDGGKVMCGPNWADRHDEAAVRRLIASQSARAA